MTTSIDGKVTGNFLKVPEHYKVSEIYYQINRNYKADSYACGRVTMQESFCGDYYPDLSDYDNISCDDYIADELTGFYAVSFDPHGKLGWKSNYIIDPDGDIGYDNAQIIEVLTESVDGRYLSYLQSLGITYIFAGKTEIDIRFALSKLKDLIGINTLLLEGGSILDGAFMEVDVIDELSLVVCPVIADTEDKPLFMKSCISEFKLLNVKQYENDIVWLNYKK